MSLRIHPGIDPTPKSTSLIPNRPIQASYTTTKHKKFKIQKEKFKITRGCCNGSCDWNGEMEFGQYIFIILPEFLKSVIQIS
jgi:hypothetical protein